MIYINVNSNNLEILRQRILCFIKEKLQNRPVGSCLHPEELITNQENLNCHIIKISEHQYEIFSLQSNKNGMEGGQGCVLESIATVISNNGALQITDSNLMIKLMHGGHPCVFRHNRKYYLDGFDKQEREFNCCIDPNPSISYKKHQDHAAKELEYYKQLYPNQAFGPFSLFRKTSYKYPPRREPEEQETVLAESFFIVIPKVGHNTLASLFKNDLIETNPNYKDQLTTQLTQQLKYLHDQDIIHCDIKPQNIVVTERDPCKSLKNPMLYGLVRHKEQFNKIVIAKLIDFGMAKTEAAAKASFQSHKKNCGTRCFMPPEVYDNEIPWTKAGDIFSLGVIFYIIHSNNPLALYRYFLKEKDPIKKSTCIQEDIAEKLKEKYFYEYTPPFFAILELIQSMLNIDPKQRPTINEVAEHLQPILS